MKNELTILLLEDDLNDADLIDRELHRGGLPFRLHRVDTQEAFFALLQEDGPDVILSDHGLPAFSGFEALALARRHCPEIPFIFVTGLMGEETAIETFESGATDYVLKNRLSKLVPVVQRALQQAAERAERRKQEEALRESEERFRMLVEGVKDYALCLLDADGRVSSWNAGAESITGFQAREIIGRQHSCFYPSEAAAQALPERALQLAEVEGRFEEEGWLVRKGGVKFWANVIITSLQDSRGQLRGFAFVTRDITQRKQEEAECERLIRDLRTALREVKTSGGRLPICASCKKIRDDQGRWLPVEAYLTEQAGATLSHQFCHECAQEIQSPHSEG